jgi:hypothetical protein
MNSTTENLTTTAAPLPVISADQAMIDLLNNIYNTLLFYYLIIPMPVGIVSNMMAIYIFTRPNLNKTAMGTYSSFIGCGNILALIFFIFIQNSQLTLGVNMLNTSDPACRMVYLFRRVIREIAPMVETLLTVDRSIVVFFPTKFTFLQKKLVILGIVLAGCVLLFILSFENAMYHLVVTVGSNNKTSASCTATAAVSIASDVVSSVMRTYIPSAVMATLNFLIILRLTKSKKSTHCRTGITRQKAFKESDFTRTVLSLNFIFLAFNFPECVAYMIKITYQDIISEASPLILAKITFMFNTIYFVATGYYMVFFFSNMIFNKVFYNEFFIVTGLSISGISQFSFLNSIFLLFNLKLKRRIDCQRE